MSSSGPRDRGASPSRGSWAVAGGGLAGSLMAAYLAKAAHQVEVYERRPDPRRATPEEGRSINLALSHRGLRALADVGVEDQVRAITVPMRGRLMHGLDGSLTLQPYGTEADQVILSVSRSDLNRILVERAAELGAEFHFGERIRNVDVDRATLTLENGDAGTRQVAHDAIIGADGAYSAVRSRLQRRSQFDYSQEYLTHGYKELSMPPDAGGAFAMDPNALHIWPRGGHMMIALPNLDRSYTCTLFWPLEGSNSFRTLDSAASVAPYFQEHFPDVPPLIPDLEEQYRTNPVGSLVTIRCGPWMVSDRVVLIGDAAHAVVPFYGQGMNASFEDCRLLMEAMGRSQGDRGRAFAEFAGSRKKDADALADLAIYNYEVMRDRVASRGFLLGKALGRMLHRVLPGTFTPLYTMVTFTSMPYSLAQQRWQQQRVIVRRAVLGAALLLMFLIALKALS